MSPLAVAPFLEATPDTDVRALVAEVVARSAQKHPSGRIQWTCGRDAGRFRGSWNEDAGARRSATARHSRSSLRSRSDRGGHRGRWLIARSRGALCRLDEQRSSSATLRPSARLGRRRQSEHRRTGSRLGWKLASQECAIQLRAQCAVAPLRRPGADRPGKRVPMNYFAHS